MKKAGPCPAFVSDRSGLLLVHLVRLVRLAHLVGLRLVRLLAVGLLLAFALFLGLALFLAVLLVHLFGLGVRLLVHAALFVLRERGEARGREHCRDEDCNQLLHVIPFSGLFKERPA